jgi:hypothetical protein
VPSIQVERYGAGQDIGKRVLNLRRAKEPILLYNPPSVYTHDGWKAASPNMAKSPI